MSYVPSRPSGRTACFCWTGRVICFLCVCILLCGAVSCSKDSPAGKLINYVLSEEPAQLDPQFASSYSSRIVLMNCREGLIRIGSPDQILSRVNPPS